MSESAGKYEEMQKLRKALTDAHETGKKTVIQDIFNQLYTIKVDEELLRTTSIGQAVGKLRNNDDVDIATQAKKLVHKWKKDVMAAKNGRLSSSTSNSRPSSGSQTPQLSKSSSRQQNDAKQSPSDYSSGNDNASKIANGKGTHGSENGAAKTGAAKTGAAKTSAASSGQGHASEVPPPMRRASSTPGSEARTAASDGATIPSTGDSQRDKCAEMLYNAMAVDSNVDSELLSKRASAIENIELKKEGSVTPGYKARIRSLYLNLKDKKNPGLRHGVVEGDITVERFCSMSKEEMASDDLKQQVEKIKEENLFKVQGAGRTQAETDQFKCGRCKGRKCTYYQMQTRSADEPMTTFVTCTQCDNRWKFC
ncbi:transcription elongation factor [Martensiomyces pterosporus]|nr:transcription elongation factor [Martensiomyces pterosporus]